jgi:hypothetical protein
MAGRRTGSSRAGASGGLKDVEAFMEGLTHARREEIEALREVIRGIDPRIHERIKWNAPSYAIDDHFLTFKLRPLDTVQVVLHTGAKVVAARTAMRISDPDGLVAWAAPDRGVVTFTDMDDLRAKQAAFVTIVQQWIAQLRDR